MFMMVSAQWCGRSTVHVRRVRVRAAHGGAPEHFNVFDEVYNRFLNDFILPSILILTQPTYCLVLSFSHWNINPYTPLGCLLYSGVEEAHVRDRRLRVRPTHGGAPEQLQLAQRGLQALLARLLLEPSQHHTYYVAMLRPNRTYYHISFYSHFLPGTSILTHPSAAYCSGVEEVHVRVRRLRVRATHTGAPEQLQRVQRGVQALPA